MGGALRSSVVRVLSGGFAISMIAAAAAAAVATPNAVADGHSNRWTSKSAGIAGGIWGDARRILSGSSGNLNGYGSSTAVACPAAGNCVVGGQSGNSTNVQPFVAAEVNRKWESSQLVPGIVALDGSGAGGVSGISCASAQRCAIVGTYIGGSFVDSYLNGVFQPAAALSGSTTIPSSGPSAAELDAVSCSHDGSCAAGGQYFDHTDTAQPFVVTEFKGKWGIPIEVPGSLISQDGKNPHASGSQVLSVSCGAPGSCVAGGYYETTLGLRAAFLVNEIDGEWRSAIPIAGLGGGPQKNSVVLTISCAGVGSCSAGGVASYGPFVVDEVGGRWGRAHEPVIKGVSNVRGYGYIAGVSCAAAGQCSAAGGVGGTHPQMFVVNELRGVWEDAIPIPGIAAAQSVVNAISCAAPLECSIGGNFERTTAPKSGSVVANEVRGVVEPAAVVPDTGASGAVSAQMQSISCASAGSCTAVGWSDGAPGVPEVALTADEMPAPSPMLSTVSPSAGRVSGGTRVILRGHGFKDSLAVMFGSGIGTHLIIIRDAELIVSAPPGRGTVEVVVDAEAGTSDRTKSTRYTYRQP